jgi:CheY-like chemotaxis protein
MTREDDGLEFSGDESRTTPIFDTRQHDLRYIRVLVLDDEAPIRLMTSRLLTHIGIGLITTVGDGAEAVELYRQAFEADHPFAVVILDLTLPGGMGGYEVFEKLKEIDPDIKGILTTGYDAGSNFEIASKGFNAVLDKPYTMEQMKRTLLGVLDMECVTA